jgi:methyl-accepting chemotaxis protein
MKFFNKVFVIFSSFIILAIVAQTYILSSQYISDSEKSVIAQNEIYGDLISKQIEVGYLQSDWPYENLNKLSKRDDFIFWWVVKPDGVIYRADNVSFIDTKAAGYFPLLGQNQRNGTYINKDQRYAIDFKSFRIGQETWTFWLGFSLDSVFRKTYVILFKAISVSGLILLILVFMLYFAAKYFTDPLKKIRDTAIAISHGDLGAKIEIRSKDEIEELAAAFNQMTADLKASRDKIESYSKDLEKEVDSRTKELKEKVDEVEAFNKLAVGRELSMVELKKKVAELEEKLAKR